MLTASGRWKGVGAPVQATITPEQLVEAPTADPSHRPLSSRAAVALGSIFGVVTAALYFVGSSRSIGDVDASVTVGAFVKTPSLLDPLRRTLDVPGFRFNNHPLFSLIEHAVWSSGQHSEAALRVAPILFGALAVALLAGECGRRLGLVPGVCAGALLAANPFFARLSRELRDYSLVVLCAVASTILLVRILEATAPRRRARVGYMVIIAAGVATHMFFAPVILAHFLIVLAQRKLDRRWVAQFLGGVLLGAAIYVGIARDMFHHQANGTGNRTFPLKAAHLLLGEQWFAVAILGGFVVWAIALYFRSQAVLLPLLAVVGIAAVLWLIVQPAGLGPRFFIWLVPAVALSAAVVVARRPWASLLVALALIAMLADDIDHWSSPSTNVAQAAAIIDAARTRGFRVCGYKAGQWAVLAYTPSPPYLPPEGVAGCDVVVEMKRPVTSYDAVIRAELPYTWEGSGRTPIVVHARIPFRQVVVPPSPLSLDAHSQTYP
jgi:Dolichyl-phosphate-mannose-protein mannosyltransferase